MKARFFQAAAVALILIAVLDAILWKLEVSRVSPVLIQYSVGPEPGKQEMNVVLSGEGILVWLSLLAIWASVLASLQGFSSRRARCLTAAGLFGIESIVLMVFDPYLLFLILDRDMDNVVLRFLRRWDVLAEIYGDWGFSRNIHWLLACQVAGVIAVLTAAHLLNAREVSNNSSPLARQNALG